MIQYTKNKSDVVATYKNLPKKFRRRYEEMLLIPKGIVFIAYSLENEVILSPNTERTHTHSEELSKQEQSSFKSEQYKTNVIGIPINTARTKSVAITIAKKEYPIQSMKNLIAARPGKSKLVQSILNRKDSVSSTSLISNNYRRHTNFI